MRRNTWSPVSCLTALTLSILSTLTRRIQGHLVSNQTQTRNPQRGLRSTFEGADKNRVYVFTSKPANSRGEMIHVDITDPRPCPEKRVKGLVKIATFAQLARTGDEPLQPQRLQSYCCLYRYGKMV